MGAKKSEFIVRDLIGKIYQKTFWNNKLPTQRALAEEYAVSRFTIQKSLKQLESFGLIEARPGDGIYVCARAIGNPLVYNSMTAVPYSDIQSKMLYCKKIGADAELASIFNLAPGEAVWEFGRLRIVRYEIDQWEIGYMPCWLAPDLDQATIESSIQNYMLDKKQRISHFMTSYRPAALTKEEAALLNCKKGTPAMAISSRGVLKNGAVFIYSRIRAIHYECTYVIPFNREVHRSRSKK